jgi:hypothetical protein
MQAPMRGAQTRQGSCVQLRLHFDERGLLTRTEFACRDRYEDDAGTSASLIALYPYHYKYSKGLRALCAVIVKDAIGSADPTKIGLTLSAQRSAVFNILKKAPVMASTGWIASIFGFTKHGDSCLPTVMINRGSDKHPSPQVRPDIDISIWSGDRNIKTNANELVKLLDRIVDYGEAQKSGPTEGKASEANGFGIIKCTANPHDRVADYKKLLIEASGDIFISGTSMISLSEDSADLLAKKVREGSQIRLLIINPDWIRENFFLLSFLPNDETRKRFYLEVLNSIAKLQDITARLPSECRDRYRLKSYRTLFPYIITGFRSSDGGKCVMEITDYLPQRDRPRFTLETVGQDNFFDMVLNKFNALWESDLSEVVF